MRKPSASTLQRAKRSRFGRFLTRLLGDQTGAVMMEYVVLGVLVVAAVVAIVIFFGDTIRNQFGVMTKATAGDHKGAETMVTKAAGERDGRIEKAEGSAKTMTNQE